jgi:anti-sigma regulatory factor (Ser/Thr protein kinase)
MPISPVVSAAESPAIPREVGPLRRWVQEVCVTTGASRDLCRDIVLAASEALTNVVMHAYVGREQPGEMRIRARVAEQRLLLEVEDDGIGIRPRIDSPGAGMGLVLIASLAAELEFGRGPGGRGALVRMAFAIP